MMQRDMELVRAILSHVQSRADANSRPLEIEGYDPQLVARHAELLVQAGLVEGRILGNDYGPPIVNVRDLTWAGHDFAAVMSNDGVWSKIKQKFTATELATMPLVVLKDVGLKLLATWAASKAGV